MSKRTKPVLLTILDGWGANPSARDNAIAQARKPTFDELMKKFPNTLVHTSGPRVGLPDGQMGNSEVGHLNMGAGRIIHMDITRIDRAIETGHLGKDPTLLQLMERGREKQLHLIGLVSDGGVHSHQEHLYALLRMAKENGVARCFVHAITDGRDTPPESGQNFLTQLQTQMDEIGAGAIATVCGRYYAMDRDQRWQRTERAYRAMAHGRVDGEAEHTITDAVEALRESYKRNTTDEFTEPIVLLDGDGKPRTMIQNADAVLFFNFRADRGRQLSRALAQPDFDGFEDPNRPADLLLATMTQYDKTFAWAKHVFGPQHPNQMLAHIFASAGLRNLRVAESEKYAHVTYFFNGGIEKPYDGEEREMVASPTVPTYDLRPEMSAAGVADTIIKAVTGGAFDVIVSNFANADMVGHSGKIEAATKAVEAVDECLGRIYQTLQDHGGAWIITADHGNAEMMRGADGTPHTYHTTNPVPFAVITAESDQRLRADGALQDVAPTILELLGLPQPKEMEGKSLLEDDA